MYLISEFSLKSTITTLLRSGCPLNLADKVAAPCAVLPVIVV